MSVISRITNEEFEKAQKFIQDIKPLLATNDVVIAVRNKNKEFDQKYNMRHEEKINVLKSLRAEDCTKIELNSNPNYPNVELYFFSKEIDVVSYGEKEQVSLYIKVYIDTRDRYDQTIVISFHENGVYD